MRAVDTNLLVRLMVRDDPRQVAAAEEFIAKGVWASHLVLAETIWVLSTVYRFSHARLVSAIELLLHSTDLVLQDSEVVLAALRHFREGGAPSFSDCLILEIARKAGHLPLGTFDRKLGAIEGAKRL